MPAEGKSPQEHRHDLVVSFCADFIFVEFLPNQKVLTNGYFYEGTRWTRTGSGQLELLSSSQNFLMG